MKKRGLYNTDGFTMIEVALVLALAGLIFLMTFIALPALQRTERDAERREKVYKLVEQIKKYQTNNRGALPVDGTSASYGGDASTYANIDNWQSFYNQYLGKSFHDPHGRNFVLQILNCGGDVANSDCRDAASVIEGIVNTDFPNNYNMYVVKQAKCAGDSTKGVVASSNPRRFAVLYKLEVGGIYCAGS